MLSINEFEIQQVLNNWCLIEEFKELFIDLVHVISKNSFCNLNLFVTYSLDIPYSAHVSHAVKIY